MWRKWHLGSAEERFPTHQGFDEWFGIPRTHDEGMWAAQNEAAGLWPSIGNKQGWDSKIAPLEPIYDARKGEKARQIGMLNLDTRRTMEAEITKRAVDFIKRDARAGKPFYAYVSSSMFHMPALPNPSLLEKPAMAMGPIVWLKWIIVLGRFSMHSSMPVSTTIRWLSSPVITGRRRPIHGKR
jgi:hypothetical protein